MFNMKTCYSCKKEKELLDFNKNSKRSDGLDNLCRVCRKAYYKEYYSRSDKERIRLLASNQSAKSKINDLVRATKDKPCTDCNIKYHYCVMQFDHLPQFKKLFNIGTDKYKYGIKAVAEEIAKCEVVCANCHAIRSWSRSHDENRNGVGSKALVYPRRRQSSN